MSFSLALQRFLLPPAAAALALTLQIGSSQAQTTPAPQRPVGPRSMERLQNLSESQKQELFSFRRSNGLRTHAAQIAILQKGERCISAAGSLEALQACRREEWTAKRELMSRSRGEARALYQRLGIPLPEREPEAGPGGARRSWGAPQGI
jgi:hypothetical protein